MQHFTPTETAERVFTHGFEISVWDGVSITRLTGGADGFEANRQARIEVERQVVASGKKPIGAIEFAN